MANIKICNECGEVYLDQIDFYLVWINRDNKYQYQPRCIKCTNKNNKERYYNTYHSGDGREYWLKRKYNITLKEYEQMLKEQNFRCAICGIHISKCIKNLAIDHNHETGEIRGLLCHNCNVGIGYLKEDEQIIINALDYLKKFK